MCLTILGDFACLDGNSTAPPTPGTIGDEDYVVVSYILLNFYLNSFLFTFAVRRRFLILLLD